MGLSIPHHFEEHLNHMNRHSGDAFSFLCIDVCHKQRADGAKEDQEPLALVHSWSGFPRCVQDYAQRCKIAKIPAMCCCKGTRIFNNMIHLKIKQSKLRLRHGLSGQLWHEDSQLSDTALNVNLHTIDPTSMRSALNVKSMCFHKCNKVCICKQLTKNGHRENHHRATTKELRMQKQAQQDADLKLLNELAALNSAPMA
eukprot:6212845-Pleurochrysis_carterae.AAC.1